MNVGNSSLCRRSKASQIEFNANLLCQKFMEKKQNTSSNVHEVYKQQLTVNSLFYSIKCRDTRDIESNLVYRIDCLNCEKYTLVKLRDT